MKDKIGIVVGIAVLVLAGLALYVISAGNIELSEIILMTEISHPCKTF